MSKDIKAIEKEYESSERISENSYYQKIQKSLQDKRDAKKQELEKSRVSHNEERLEIQKDTPQKDKNRTQVVSKMSFDIQDKVHIKSSPFNWKADESETLDSHNSNTRSNRKSQTEAIIKDQKIIKILGMKIDMTSKMADIKEAYMQNVIQSRSHNFFLSRFAAFKVGILGQILSLIGVSVEDIKRLKNEALKKAIEENIQLMGENTYNIELTELVHGRGKKVRRSLATFKEVETQLIKQMACLGKPNYWNATRIYEERIEQCKKIEEEFIKEKTNLKYQLEYYTQDKDSNE